MSSKYDVTSHTILLRTSRCPLLWKLISHRQDDRCPQVQAFMLCANFLGFEKISLILSLVNIHNYFAYLYHVISIYILDMLLHSYLIATGSLVIDPVNQYQSVISHPYKVRHTSYKMLSNPTNCSFQYHKP